jgi:PAS domain S-box-containing protein
MTFRDTINLKLLAGPTASIICIALLLATIFSVENQDNERAQRYTHAVSVIQLTGEVAKDLTDMETAQQSYWLTRQDEFVEPYEIGRNNLPIHLKVLQETVGKESVPQKHLAQFKATIAPWLNGPRWPSSAKQYWEGQRIVQTARESLDAVQEYEQAKLEQLTSRRRYARQAIEVLASTPRLERLIVAMEAGQRAYGLTGDKQFARSYEQARIEWPLVLGYLNNLVASEPSALNQLKLVEQKVRQWQTNVAQPAIDARAAGRIPGPSLAYRRGKEVMEGIRQTLSEFKAEAFKRYDREKNAADEENWWRLTTLASASIGALLLLASATAYSVISVKRHLHRAEEAEAKVRASEGRFQNFMSNSPAVAFMKDEQLRYVYINDTFERLFEQDAEKVRGKTDFDCFPADVAKELQDHDREILKSQQARQVLEKMPHPNGQVGEWLVAKFPFQDAAGQKYVGGMAIEVTKERRALQDLAEEQERLRVTLRSIGDGVITTDTKGRIILLNKVAEHLTGWTQEEATGKPLMEVFQVVDEISRSACPNPMDRVLENGQIMELSSSTILIGREGVERAIAHSAAPIYNADSKAIGVVLVFRDVTEKMQREVERMKAERLEAIGLLAGGIAHDFNNILTAIVGNIALARLEMGDNQELEVRLGKAEKASYRARDLAQQLLTFAKGGAPVKKTASIAHLIKEVTEFFLRGSKAKAELEIPEDLWPVNIDQVQIGQVVENIVVNAEQSMPEGGLIHVLCENVVLPTGKEGAPRRCVRIVIRDEGEGIPKEYLPKIFDPYFTTKPKGSGLGLATAYSIIKKHEGLLTVESELGDGTAFTILLPASAPDSVVVEPVPAAQMALGGGRILFMDDEPMIRELMPGMLAPFGYDVVSAADGGSAIGLYEEAKKEGKPFSVVIMDLTVPGGLGGKETLQRLLKLDPKVKAIVSSGYANDPVMAHYEEFGFKGMVHKPYEITDLQRVVHHVIFDS